MTPDSHLPEIDEAGYASLIIAADGTKTLVDVSTGEVLDRYKGSDGGDSPRYQEIGMATTSQSQAAAKHYQPENTYQNVETAEEFAPSVSLIQSDFLSHENPYVNEVVGDGAPDTYAKVDLSKKKRESGVYRAAEVATEKLGVQDDDGDDDEEDLVNKFESFFSTSGLVAGENAELTISKC